MNENNLRLIKICDHVAKCLKLEDRKTFVYFSTLLLNG